MAHSLKIMEMVGTNVLLFMTDLTAQQDLLLLDC
jgi:hypothetical protein